ncbi:hypothetical protein BDZ97DRAFT_1904192 [Flammula alnicola]|nr:hypothetical protein BDZ97DRAFT_1904192 [Flammula alnicola]
MRSQIALLLACITCVIGLPQVPFEAADRLSRKCGTEGDNHKLAQYERSFQQDRIPFLEGIDATSSAVIQTHFHIIVSDASTEAEGSIPDVQLQMQMSTLNSDYRPTGLSFDLASVDTTVNKDWFTNGGPGTPQQAEMKKNLRKGGAKDLNVYTVDFTGSWAGLLGYSTFPVAYKSASDDDGIVILYSTLPGGNSAPYNLGRTLTHESGHWVGLYHTFQGGCTDPGDYVSDTPQEATPASGCPISRDTCSSAGADPTQNFMDYSDDSCMNNFTPLQTNRMKSQLMTYRNMTF